MGIPFFPEFAPLSIDQKSAAQPALLSAADGVSEFTFAGLYLFRKRYQYRLSMLEDGNLVISGIQPPHALDPAAGQNPQKEKKFFMTPCAVPDRATLEELFKTHDYWKNIPESILLPNKERLTAWGVEFTEDRDNYDYLYLRADLADLSGKKYHKKRNLVTQFLKNYSHYEKDFTPELIPEAVKVLERWRIDKGDDGDYAACKEALDLYGELNMDGMLLYVDGEAAGWCLGEPVANGKIFTIHFEKCIEGFKGIYQFINQAFAASLPEYFIHINREQDLGDEGLRQAKMTYRPSGFVHKYTGNLK